jgi:hypothetical protein
LSVGGTAAGGLLDYKASTDRTSALKDIADRSWNAGQPYRDRANSAMAPGFDLNSIPGYSGALSTGMDATSWAGKNIALPAWQNYFSSNSNAGGLSNLATQATGAATNAADSTAAGIGSIGQTARNLFDPQPNYQKQYLDLLGKQYGLA